MLKKQMGILLIPNLSNKNYIIIIHIYVYVVQGKCVSLIPSTNIFFIIQYLYHFIIFVCMQINNALCHYTKICII